MIRSHEHFSAGERQDLIDIFKRSFWLLSDQWILRGRQKAEVASRKFFPINGKGEDIGLTGVAVNEEK